MRAHKLIGLCSAAVLGVCLSVWLTNRNHEYQPKGNVLLRTSEGVSLFRSDICRTGHSSTEPLSTFQEVAWKFKAGDTIFASPVVWENTLYFGDANGIPGSEGGLHYLYALDCSTGNLKWKCKTNDVYSTPAVGAKAIYVGAGKGLIAIDRHSAKLQWDFQTGNAVTSSPLIAHGRVFFASTDGFIYCVDADTGVERWKFKTADSVRSSPALGNLCLYVGSDDRNLYALDCITGKERWRFQTGGCIPGTPAVANDTVYVGSLDGNLYALKSATGIERWRYHAADEIVGSPAIAANSVFVGTMCDAHTGVSRFVSVNCETGVEQWRVDVGGNVRSSASTAGGIVYFGSEDNHLYAVDANTGAYRWRFKATRGISSSPVVLEGRVYFGCCYEGCVYSLR